MTQSLIDLINSPLSEDKQNAIIKAIDSKISLDEIIDYCIDKKCFQDTSPVNVPELRFYLSNYSIICKGSLTHRKEQFFVVVHELQLRKDNIIIRQKGIEMIEGEFERYLREFTIEMVQMFYQDNRIY